MDERLRRNIPSSRDRGRYGQWELTSDLPPGQSAAPVRPDEVDEWEVDDEAIGRLMRRQRRLSLAMAALLVAVAFGAVVAGYLWPEVMTKPVWHGFSPLLLFAGVLIYPLIWFLAVVYTVVANRMDGLG